MQGPKNMFEMLVSRFLYVLCWRNKVVIILIILSASVGMLMMLSYHGNKHPGSVDEVLRSGKSRITIKADVAHKDQGGPFPKANQGLNHKENPKQQWGNRQYFDRGTEQQHVPRTGPPGFLGPVDHKKGPPGSTPALAFNAENDDMRASKKGLTPEKDAGKERQMAQSRKRKYDLFLRGGDRNSKQDAGMLGAIHNKTRKAHIKSLLKETKTKRKSQSLERVNKHLAKGLYQEEIDVTKNVFSDEIKVEKDRILSSDKNGKARKSGDDRPLKDLKVANQFIERENRSSHKNVNRSAPFEMGKRERVNNTNFIDRRKEQEIILAKLRKKNKIDALLKVLNKHSTVQSPTVQSSSNRKIGKKNLLFERAEGFNHDKTGRGKGLGKTLSLENTLVGKPTGKPNAENMPVWHRDHYHRDENVVIMQDKVMKNGEPQFVLKQSSTKTNDGSAGLNNNGAATIASHRGGLNHLAGSDVSPHIQSERKNPTLISRLVNGTGSINKFLGTPKLHLASNLSNLFAMAHKHSLKKFKPKHASISFRANGLWPDRLAEWLESEEKFCDGRFIAYSNEFAFVKDVIMDRNFCHGRKGGELIVDVINQPEEEEYYTYFPGFFQIPCPVQPQYFFNNNNHLNQWLYSVSNTPDSQLYSERHTEFSVLVVRYEYANLYHTMTDWYNAFILMEYFNKTQTDTNIVIVDGHPTGALDSVWNVLFNSSKRISAQSMRTKYSQLVWNTLGYNSLMMDHYAPTIPLIEEFRTFFLSSFRISEERKLDCDRISILFIWRRDYVAHPRNPTGSISRKIQNEQELVITLRQNFPTFTVKGVQIDLFEMDQQLKFVTETDILIGMHGAGLTHALFLPKHGGMIELLPTYWSAANEHFHAIARWRHIHYRQWTNSDPENEAPNHFTKIPPEVLNSLVVDMVKVVCGLATDPPDAFN